MTSEKTNGDNIFLSLGLRDCDIPQIWKEKWEQSSGGTLLARKQTITEADIREINKYLKLPEAYLQAYIQTAEIIKKNEHLEKLLWLNNDILFKSADSFFSEQYVFPDLKETMGPLGKMFPAVLLLTGLPDMLDYYKSKNINKEILIDTLSDIRIWMADCYQKTAQYGLTEFWWLYNHIKCRLFRIGRLQFMYTTFRGNIRVYRHKQNCMVLALSEPGIAYRKDGQIDGTNGIPAGEDGWVSQLVFEKGFTRGTLLSPFGYALSVPICLRNSQWVEVLCKGRGVLDVHIPAEGKLDNDACALSFKKALEFFEGHFPALQISAFVCTSWLLDSQLREILNESSNIIKFQGQFYLYPILSDDEQIYVKVFQCEPGHIDPKKVTSSLQKAILSYIAQGYRFHDSAMFMLKEDVQYYGTSHYIENFRASRYFCAQK